jgi:hypothetical protein
MKAKLEYHLPEDETEFNWARNGYEYWAELRDIRDSISELKEQYISEVSVNDLYERYIANSSIDMDV